MFATKEGERLYLCSWNYNALLILDELARIVEGRGGRVERAKTAVITNRTLSGGIRDLSGRIELLKEVNEKQGSNPAREKAIAESKARLEELKKIDNEPIKVRGQSWIRFVLNDTMYYYSFDDNPLFDFNYIKTPIISGQYSCNAVAEPDPRDWFLDSYLSYSCSPRERELAALRIFRMLVHSRNCEIRFDKEKVRVSNRYNNGHHYEMVPEKERWTEVNF